jgi:hypothetical protein
LRIFDRDRFPIAGALVNESSKISQRFVNRAARRIADFHYNGVRNPLWCHRALINIRG